MQDKFIIKNIDKLSDKIIEILIPHFKKYLSIKQEYIKSGISDKFKKDFCIFYGLNGGGGLNPAQKDKYFSLLYDKEDDLKKILLALYKVPGFAHKKRLYLSFASKLIHTIDNKLPIYDRGVSSILCLPNATYCISLEKGIGSRIDIYIDVYTELRRRFDLLLNNKEIKTILKKNRKRLSLPLPSLVSDAKLLDSVLWALFKIGKKIRKSDS